MWSQILNWVILVSCQTQNLSRISSITLFFFFFFVGSQEKIKPTIPRSGFSALKHALFGPPKMNRALHEERNLVFAIAQCMWLYCLILHFTLWWHSLLWHIFLVIFMRHYYDTFSFSPCLIEFVKGIFLAEETLIFMPHNASFNLDGLKNLFLVMFWWK